MFLILEEYKKLFILEEKEDYININSLNSYQSLHNESKKNFKAKIHSMSNLNSEEGEKQFKKKEYEYLNKKTKLFDNNIDPNYKKKEQENLILMHFNIKEDNLKKIEMRNKGMDSTKIISNRPKNLVFKSSVIVKCSFCNLTSENRSKCGPFYGPFIHKGKYHYIHEYCALFSPNIYIGPDGMLKNVIYDIHLAYTEKCCYCKIKGASLKCQFCKNKYHFVCAKITNSSLDFQNFRIICPIHKNLDNEYNGDLNSDIVCRICQSGLDEDQLLICSKCELSYHTYCLNPKIEKIPDDDWFCNNCLKKIK